MNPNGYTTRRDIDEMMKCLDDQNEIVRPMSKTKKVVKIISTTLFAIVVTFLVLTFLWIVVAKSNGKTPSLFGVYVFEVQTGSMQPTLPVNSLIVSRRPSDVKNLKTGVKSSSNSGDIVTFTMLDGRRVTHRLIDKAYDADGNFIGYRTCGDNPINTMDEEALTFDRIIAVFWFKVPLT